MNTEILGQTRRHKIKIRHMVFTHTHLLFLKLNNISELLLDASVTKKQSLEKCCNSTFYRCSPCEPDRNKELHF